MAVNMAANRLKCVVSHFTVQLQREMRSRFRYIHGQGIYCFGYHIGRHLGKLHFQATTRDRFLDLEFIKFDSSFFFKIYVYFYEMTLYLPRKAYLFQRLG